MGAIRATDHIMSVGVQDKNLKVFDIIMETQKGTTYNSYIVQGKDKTVLFDAVKDKFCDEYFRNIEEVCPLSSIDYIVCSHTEPDHSGCMARLMELAPNATVLASQTGLTFLEQVANQPIKNSQAVADGTTIDIGGMTLNFLYVPMLHWPDTIFTWIPEIGALFTCDVFGCHYADDGIFNDVIGDDPQFAYAYKYYFDNIIGPYKVPHMANALEKIKDLPISFVGTGHGPVLRADIPKYIDMYRQWCTPVENTTPTVAIAYVSAYGYTRALALQMAEGLKAGGVGKVELFDLVTADMAEAQKAIEAADGILLGSPTLVGDALPPVYEVMLCLNPVIHRGKFAGAFGSYGWSGEAAHNVTARLNQLHLNLPLPALRVRLKPTDEDLAEARKFGVDFAAAMQGKPV